MLKSLYDNLEIFNRIRNATFNVAYSVLLVLFKNIKANMHKL